MPKVRVELNSQGVEELLNDLGVADHLEGLAAQVAAAAISSAPVDSGEYRDSIDYWLADTDRVVGRVGSDSDHALQVEARTGNLARALDVVGGAEDPLELIDYVTAAGKKRKATRRQVEHWTRNRR